MKNVLKHIIVFLFLALMAFAPVQSMAQDAEQPKKEKFDAKSFIFGHTGTAIVSISRKSMSIPSACGCPSS